MALTKGHSSDGADPSDVHECDQPAFAKDGLPCPISDLTYNPEALLRTANLSVTEICLLVGFASLGSFSARFRDLVGRSPSEYRDDAVARTGVPPIPGCVLLMWTRPHPAEEQSGRSTSRLRRATVPREPQPKEQR